MTQDRYSHVTCAVCQRRYQRLDFGCSAHRLTCPEIDRAIAEFNADENAAAEVEHYAAAGRQGHRI